METDVVVDGTGVVDVVVLDFCCVFSIWADLVGRLLEGNLVGRLLEGNLVGRGVPEEDAGACAWEVPGVDEVEREVGIGEEGPKAVSSLPMKKTDDNSGE